MFCLAQVKFNEKKIFRRPDLLPITKECLYYMAPELIRLIGTSKVENAFSNASDVFAFGYDEKMF